MGFGDWGLGIGDWGLGRVAHAQCQMPPRQTPNPKTHLPQTPNENNKN